MASEIRVNTINNRSGLGTITISDTGAVFAGVTTITSLQVTGTLIGVANTDNIRTNTNATFLQNVNVSGAVTSTGMIVTGVTTVAAGSTSVPSISPSGDTNTGIFFPSADTIAFGEGGAEAARIDSSGRFGIGTTPSYKLDVDGVIRSGSSSTSGSIILTTSGATEAGWMSVGPFNWHGGSDFAIGAATSKALLFGSNNAERARIDTSGRLLVGTSTARENFFNSVNGAQLQLEGTTGPTSRLSIVRNSADNGEPTFVLAKSRGSSVGSNTAAQSGDFVGLISFQGSDGSEFVEAAQILAAVDGTPGANDMPGRLVFLTTADGASSPTERMRIDNGGSVFINGTNADPGGNNVVGCTIGVNTGSYISVTRDNAVPLVVNRKTGDGGLVSLRQDGTEEGSISVSGTTVQLNGAHLSRWSQLPGGAPRTEILRGSVLSNLDEMCEWGDEDNEQLNRTKVSDVEGDKNVAGVFVAWDNDDDTYTDDFYCAMTGDFIIRIGAGVTVERGDLLMSAGDGTAKPQGDGYVQDKTIAKVTSTHVTCTYDDGSYCVPCVLMAC